MPKRLIGGPGTRVDEGVKALINEAHAALPGLEADAVELLLPRARNTGRCRICGATARLTREHIPPASAFNRESSLSHTVDDWLRRDQGNKLPGGTPEDDGVWGYTLCLRCNNFTGNHYVVEYRDWAFGILNMVAAAATSAGVNIDSLDAQPSGPFEMGLGTRKPRPGAFVREVLAMMCNVSADFDLAGRYPVFRRIILDGAREPLPDGMSIGLTAYVGGFPRFVGPTLVLHPAAGSWQWLMEVAFPPLATLMVLKSNVPARHTFDLSDFTLLGSKEAVVVKGRLDCGVGHTILPGDYRTQAMIDADRNGPVGPN